MQLSKIIYFFMFFSLAIASFKSHASSASQLLRHLKGKKSSKRFYQTGGRKRSNYWQNFKNWFQKPQTKKNVASGAKFMAATSVGLVAFYKFKNWLYGKESKQNIVRLNKGWGIEPIIIEPRAIETIDDNINIRTRQFWDTVRDNNVDAARKAINQDGVDVNAQSSGGWTPLFTAINKQNLEMVKLLIEHGANVNYKMKDVGHNALFIASQQNNKGIIQLLLEKGLDINQQNKFGETPLFWATNWVDSQRKDHIEIVKFLIKNGANVNIENNSGDSVLSQICKIPYFVVTDPRKLALIKVLLEAGADWNKENVLRAAEKEGKILNILEEHLTKKYHKIN